MFKIGKCDDISCEHEGTDVIFEIQNLLTTCPDTRTFLQVTDPSRPNEINQYPSGPGYESVL